MSLALSLLSSLMSIDHPATKALRAELYTQLTADYQAIEALSSQLSTVITHAQQPDPIHGEMPHDHYLRRKPRSYLHPESLASDPHQALRSSPDRTEIDHQSEHNTSDHAAQNNSFEHGPASYRPHNAVFDKISAGSEDHCGSPNADSTTDEVINCLLEGSADGSERVPWDMSPVANSNHGEERRPESTSDTQEPTGQNSAQPLHEPAVLEATPLPEADRQEQLVEEPTTQERIVQEDERGPAREEEPELSKNSKKIYPRLETSRCRTR
jgi:hypothetical protein